MFKFLLDSTDPLTFGIALIIPLLIMIIIFVVIRELVMWYWKINRRVELLEEQNILLKEIVKKLDDK